MMIKAPKKIMILVLSISSLCFSLNSVASIDDVLMVQSDEAKTRYQYRNPKQTLEFFGVKEGMTVVEALPGTGWYSKILLPFVGEKGTLIGVDYPQSLWKNFSFMTPEAIKAKETWVKTWAETAEGWRNKGDAKVAAFQFKSMPKSMKGTADIVLFIRALHNLARFENKSAYLSSALEDAYSILKKDGIVGVVQHQALDDRPNSWADGSNGYLKKADVIEKFESRGFKLIAESDMNINPKDQASEGDFVWRLPPTLIGSKDNAEKKAAMLAIGESNRMTLLFKKVNK